jgi:phasin family protein
MPITFLFNLYRLEITMLTVEQIVASNKANLDTLFGLTTKAFAGVEKMVELNVTAAKAALAESTEHAKASLSVKDAQEFMALQAGMIQPLAEKTAAYSRHLYDIASSASAEFTKNVEEQAADAQKKLMGLVDTASKNAPAGSESAVTMMKSAVAAANNAFESEMAEKNFAAASETAMKATASATATKKR